MSTVGFAVELEAELVVPEGRSPDWISPIIISLIGAEERLDAR